MKNTIKVAVIAFAISMLTACSSNIDTESSSTVIEAAVTTTTEAITEATTTAVTTTVTTALPAETEAITTITEVTTTASAITTAAITTAVTTTAKPVTTAATTQATTAATTQAITTKATTAATTAPAPTSGRTEGFQADIQAEYLKILNEYRTANGVPTIALDNSWKIYAERLAKFNSDNNLISHGPFAIEIVYNPLYTSSDTSATAVANHIMNGFKNSTKGHAQSMLDLYGGETIRHTNTYCAVYYNPIKKQYSTIIVLMYSSCDKYNPTYESALSNEVWWDNYGSWNGVTGTIYRDWSEEDLKAEFERKGLKKYYPHLA